MNTRTKIPDALCIGIFYFPRDLNPKRVRNVKKTVLWTVFSSEVRGGYCCTATVAEDAGFAKQSRVPSSAPKIGKLKGLPIFYPLRKQWYIIAEGVYHHPTGCISSAVGCICFRNDNIQNFVLMRYNTSC